MSNQAGKDIAPPSNSQIFPFRRGTSKALIVGVAASRPDTIEQGIKKGPYRFYPIRTIGINLSWHRLTLPGHLPQYHQR